MTSHHEPRVIAERLEDRRLLAAAFAPDLLEPAASGGNASAALEMKPRGGPLGGLGATSRVSGDDPAARRGNSRGGLKAVISAATAMTGRTNTARAVFSSTNEASGNAVVMYQRGSDGRLSLVDQFPTGGTGTGGSLGNQGAVVRSDDGRWLLVVNAGSDDLTVFRIGRDGLVMTDLAPSGGDLPVSVTIHRNLVYVLNAGGAGNITGFTLDRHGQLQPLAGSTRPLSGAAATAPAQVEFSPDGSLLVVTEKATNLIDTYRVNRDGLAGAPQVQPSVGVTPFGFAFASRRSLIVSEAFGGAPDASAVSSYFVDRDGDLDVESASVPTTETAACWIVVTSNGRLTYTTNTGSGTITGYAITRRAGGLRSLDADGVTAATGAGSAPTDMALSSNGRFLYALNSATGEIDVFAVNKSDGSLTPVQSIDELPPNATGLAA